MKRELQYDHTNPSSIEDYAKRLVGKNFLSVIENADLEPEVVKETVLSYGNPRRKGGLGNLLEKHYFEYEVNSDQNADFPEAGVELKVSTYEKRKKGGISAGERLVITMISYNEPVEYDFLKSHVFNKINLMLLIYYWRNKELLNKLLYPIDYVTLFSPPEEDMEIIMQDYSKIIKKIEEGKAHELSEGDTMYLGAATKGSNAENSTVPQFQYAPDVKARKRAFCLKNSYMTHVLNTYISKNISTYEKIITTPKELETISFEDLIINKINQHKGKRDSHLFREFGLDVSSGRSKNIWSILAYRMLGVKSKKALEFEKANIEVKAIRIESNGSMTECISFPAIEMSELANIEWEESDLYNDLESKRFLFVVFKKDKSGYHLKGCQLWNMPIQDLQTTVKDGWESIQQIIRSGVILTKNKHGNGFRINNNFPKKTDNEIIHIRPHTSKRYYELQSGEIVGTNKSYGDKLPNGIIMTKQSFWLNNTYILSQLSNELKN